MSAHGAFTERSLRTHGALTTGSEGKGKEGIRDQEGSGSNCTLDARSSSRSEDQQGPWRIRFWERLPLLWRVRALRCRFMEWRYDR